MNFKLQQLWHAVALAEAGSYTLASRRVHLSQPALSRSIKRLEDECGAVLFDRTPEGVIPTAVGMIIIRRGATLLRSSRDLQREVEMTMGLNAGSICIGAGTYPADISVGEACGRLLAQHPGLTVDVRIGDWSTLVDAVLEGDIDIAVAETYAATGDERLVVEQLPTHRGYFICRTGHPLTGKQSLTLDDIRGFALVAATLPPRLDNLSTTLRVDSFSLIRDIVLYSDAIGLATANQVAKDEGTAMITRLPLDAPYLHTGYGFIQLRSRTPSPAALAFMEMLRGVESRLA